MGSDCGMSLFISYCNFILLEKNPNNIVNKTIVTIIKILLPRINLEIFFHIQIKFPLSYQLIKKYMIIRIKEFTNFKKI